MSSPVKQQAQPQKRGWGSMLSSAVAGLESRLDTILAEDSEASARSRAAEQALKEAKGRPRSDSDKLKVPSRANSVMKSADASRDTSRTRASERLAERLAKATAAKTVGSNAPSVVGSEVPSRPETPATKLDSPKVSGEESRGLETIASTLQESNVEQNEEDVNAVVIKPGAQNDDVLDDTSPSVGLLQSSGLPINPARLSHESDQRPSTEISNRGGSARPSIELMNGHANKSAAELETEVKLMRTIQEASERQRQEDMHAHLERIDALQAKLRYLANETVAAAKEANASALVGSPEARLAEKDERIALLMEEGEKLSKTELKHLQNIRKLRARQVEDEKTTAELQRRLSKLETSEKDLKARLLRAERVERQSLEKVKQVEHISNQVDQLQVDRENASELIRNLTFQLRESEKRTEEVRSEVNVAAAEADKSRIASLENELEDARIEKKLAEDRAAFESRKVREEMERQAERFRVSELELKSEMSGLESRLEAMRARAEEAGAESSGEANVSLLRQTETLQNQYALAKDNWETIEGSLTARIAALEKERDEAVRGEADVRKKAREAGIKGRRVEEELDAKMEEINALTQEAQRLSENMQALQRKSEQAETALGESRADLNRQRKIWDSDLASKIEEERAKWHRSLPATALRPETPIFSGQRQPTPDLRHQQGRKQRLGSHEVFNVQTDRTISRRSSTMPLHTVKHPMTTPERELSPHISRQDSTFSIDPNSIPPTPSVDVDDDFDRSFSPQQTVNDLVSTANAEGAGPSVQLVERMSAAVRRLEAEKASHKDELQRLTSQRDDARNDVVELMREVEASRSERSRIEALETDMKELRRRYEASLEMLGEREEEVEELKDNVADMKKMYRELVEEKIGGK